ncbi:hypothetical protein PRZ48_005636 [Zasmidium cellare]|uniref:Phenol 2-monooxygenase n=1 Tax=Zasmidium cellare TaxID=395010 RepID=A0ABR0ELS3_ZASCE|nr:hypothetical protein PRZ48_005636 [Zasmidium cellare]
MGSSNSDSHVDVLIVGAGPAGMMASMHLSELGISHRIIDHRGTRTLNGRADGFHVPTVEIWESFGLYNHIEQYGERFGHWGLWTFGEDPEAGIYRQHRGYIPSQDKARHEIVTMNQGMIEAALGDGVRARNGPVVERGTKPVELTIDESLANDLSSYPITARVYHARKSELPDVWTGAHTVQEDGSLKRERGFIDAFGTDPHEFENHVNGVEGTTETIHAKYVIGTDGAHSWVRRQLPDFKMEGDTSDEVFGVVDIIPSTNFPDIRKTCSILSRAGFLLQISRENGLVRLYVQFPEGYETSETKAKDNEAATLTDILAAARKMYYPYTMDYKYCDWWTIYRVGQRVCNKASHLDRIFLAGDAIHTHSPKGGQGMNVSQHDTYSLTWKIAGVLKSQLPPSVLQTYEQERLPIARNLIELDNDMAKVLLARANRDEAEVQRVYKRLSEFSGAISTYKTNMVVGNGARQNAAAGLPIGSRFSNATVYSQADGPATPTQSLLKSNGLWRLIVFAGDVSSHTQLSKVNALGDRLAALQQRYPPLSTRQKHFLEILLFHASPVSAVEFADFHNTFFPKDDILGRNYYTIYGDEDGVDALEKEKRCHAIYRVDETKGALVVVRPDQITAWVGGLDDVGEMEDWLAGFMVGKAEGKRKNSPRDEQDDGVM